MDADDLRTAYELGRDDADDVEDELADLRAEVERLRDAIRQWHEFSAVTGRHRGCSCPACETLWKLSQEGNSDRGN